MRVARLWAGVAGCMALALGGCAPPPGQGAPPGRSEPSGRRFVNPGTLAALDGFTHAVRLGFVTYVSGEVALDSTGALVGPGDLAAQARQAFANLALTLRIAGSTPDTLGRLIFIFSEQLSAQ